MPNIVVIGNNFPESQKHIADAQSGRGSNEFNISAVVTYKQGANKSRSWLRYTKECKIKMPGTDCDEYPYATTKEGGKKSYHGKRVSLRRISSNDNQASGRLWGRATRGMNGEKFIVAPIGSHSFYIKNGKFGL